MKGAATAAGLAEARLLWDNTPNDEAGYEIQRATNSDFTENVTMRETGADKTSLRDTPSMEGNWTKLFYRVRAKGQGNTDPSAWSDAVSVSKTKKVAVRFASTPEVTDVSSMVDTDPVPNRLNWFFYGTSHTTDSWGGVIDVSVGATGGRSGLPLQVIPQQRFSVKIGAKQIIDPNTGPKWVLDIDGVRKNQLFPSADNKVSCGIDMNATGNGDTSATLSVLYAAQYNENGNGINGMTVGPIGVSWSRTAHLKHSNGGDWVVRLEQIDVLE